MIDMILNIALQNLLSPLILFFMLGLVAGFIKSDLEIPDIMARSLALFLVAAIGLKGGINLADHGLSPDIITVFGLAVVACALMPFIGFALLRTTTSLDPLNASVLTSHYGSVSLVTFIACGEFLSLSGFTYTGWLIALLAVMETPAILSGLFLARRYQRYTGEPHHSGWVLLKEVFLNGTVVLLLGCMAIGYFTPDTAMTDVKSFFIDPFKGVLCFFLLDMGLLIGRKTKVLRNISFSVFLFGIYMPFIGAAIGYAISHFTGLALPETVMVMTLFASASYIAVPATMKLAVPEADPGIYMTLPIGITFPFNIIVGIPLYYAVAKTLEGVF